MDLNPSSINGFPAVLWYKPLLLQWDLTARNYRNRAQIQSYSCKVKAIRIYRMLLYFWRAFFTIEQQIEKTKGKFKRLFKPIYSAILKRVKKLQEIHPTNKELGALVGMVILTVQSSLSHMKQKLIPDSSNEMVVYYKTIVKREQDVWPSLTQAKYWKTLSLSSSLTSVFLGFFALDVCLSPLPSSVCFILCNSTKLTLHYVVSHISHQHTPLISAKVEPSLMLWSVCMFLPWLRSSIVDQFGRRFVSTWSVDMTSKGLQENVCIYILCTYELGISRKK